jgi:hypothetical protein
MALCHHPIAATDAATNLAGGGAWRDGQTARRPLATPLNLVLHCCVLLAGAKVSVHTQWQNLEQMNQLAHGMVSFPIRCQDGSARRGREQSMDPLFQELRINMAATPVPTGVDGRWRRRMATLGPHSCLPSPLVSGTPFCNSICRSGFFHRDLLTSRH